MRIVIIMVLSATASFAQSDKTIRVKEDLISSRVLLNPTFTHLIVLDKDSNIIDSCIVSFKMIVTIPTDYTNSTPYGNITVMSQSAYISQCSYLTSEMRKAWNDNPPKRVIYFQDIIAIGADKKQHRLKQFTVFK